MDDWATDFLAEERLPQSFRFTLDEVCGPLADRALDWRTSFGRTAVVGLCGAQGSGKSTIARATVRILAEAGRKAVALSLDDFYLSREARGWLARKVHPLLAVRGPPGTHDAALACAVIDNLARAGQTPLPAFDKAADERKPKAEWGSADGPLDVVILEGWCVGARPEPEARLAAPINTLERQDDPDGVWRKYVNRQLAELYQALFARLDRLVLLQAPGFDVVRTWRTEQEAKLRARAGPGAGMSDTEIAVFIQHYERLTRWILEEMPARADWVIPLDSYRMPGP
ncbi:kinase [uncultured Phenylobacterium sp.]|uniref:kinase n=1 Tax=uncultured Phenylobacterium sp. TaxID=349273 RepID=UPI0025D08ED9|nr:kinase [uncultured Phenylobacterium sp.]